FTLSGIAPGPVFLSVASPDTKKLLGTETRRAIVLPPGGTVAGIALVLSARPSDTATYVGMNDNTGCATFCHGPNNKNTGDKITAVKSAAHFRSLARIPRDGNGRATPGAFSRALNPTLT